MTCVKPRTTALAVGLTVAILYSLCALVFAIAPSLAAGFVNAVNHGVNLSSLDIGTVPFTFGAFIVGLVSITAYSLLAGWIYGVIRNRLQQQRGWSFEASERVARA